ncbi:hypothetical protein KAH81_06510 [bacterium]|nr:hypothetical protein [bacterium]
MCAGFLTAAQSGIEVRSSGSDFFEAKPGGTITVPLNITNRTARTVDLIPNVDIPDGWNIVNGGFPFKLGAGESDLRLLNFHIPKWTPSGEYEITYSVGSKIKYPYYEDRHNVTVVVIPVLGLRAELFAAPEYVIAGDEYDAFFFVKNESNATRHIELKLKSNEDFPFTVDRSEFALAPGESRRVSVNVEIPENLKKESEHRIELTAKGEKVKGYAESRVKVIPIKSRLFSGVHKLPVEIGLRGGITIDDDTTYRFFPDIRGAGPLDSGGKVDLEFHYRGRETRNNATFNEFYTEIPEKVFDEKGSYGLGLRAKHLNIHIGDGGASSTRLTDGSYGRGIQVGANMFGLDIGGHYQRANWYADQEEKIAGHAGYSFKGIGNIGFNYVRKEYESDPAETDTGTTLKQTGYREIGSIDCGIGLFKNNRIDFEFASEREIRTPIHITQNNSAYFTRLSGNQKWISYNVYYTRAGADYSSYSTDRERIDGYIALPIWKTLRLNGNFYRQRDNLSIDDSFDSAPIDNRFQGVLSYSPFIGNNIGLVYEYCGREDLLHSPVTLEKEDIFKVRLGQNVDIQPISLYSLVELGSTIDRSTGDASSLEKYSFSVHCRPTDGQTFSFQLEYHNNDLFEEDDRRYFVATLNGSFHIGEWLSANMNLQSGGRRDYFLEHHIGERNYFDGGLCLHLPFNLDIALEERYALDDNTDLNETALTVEYNIPFGLPIGLKTGTGEVEGRIFDEETGEALPGVALNLNGYTTVTDDDGSFIFKSVTAKKYYLTVKTSRLGKHRITSQKSPISVIVKRGKTVSLEIGITDDVAISGFITLYDFDAHSLDEAGTSLVETRDLAGVTVELSDGRETLKQITDSEGMFQFLRLRPGKWTLRIKKDNIPERYYLEKDVIEIDITPGQVKGFRINVLPEKRRIRIIKNGGTIRENTSR